MNEVKKIFKQSLNRSINDNLAIVLAKYSLNEVEFVAKTLKQRLQAGKITNPIGLLMKDPEDVITNILNGGLYSDKPMPKEETDVYYLEIKEFEELTGLQLNGKVRRNKYAEWRSKFSKEVVFKAAEIMTLRTKNGSLEYMDRILKDWEYQKVTKVSDIKIKQSLNKKTTNNDYEIYVPPSKNSF